MKEDYTSQIVPSPSPERKSFQIAPEIGKLLEQVSEEISTEIIQIIESLHPNLRRTLVRVENETGQKPDYGHHPIFGEVKMGTEKDLEDMVREIRHEKGEWTPEEISELDEENLELLLRRQLGYFLQRQDASVDYINVQVLKKLSNENVSDELVGYWLNEIWNNRNSVDQGINYPERERWRIKTEEFDSLSAELESLKSTVRARLDKHKKGRISAGALQALEPIWQRIYEITGKKYYVDMRLRENGLDFYEPPEGQNAIGKLREELKNREQAEVNYRTLIYASQYFSAQDFAVIAMETFSDVLTRGSNRLSRKEQPTVEAWIQGSINKWAISRQEEGVIYQKEKVPESRKIEILCEQFLRRLKSYVLHKHNSALTEETKQANEREIIVPLRILKKISEK